MVEQRLMSFKEQVHLGARAADLIREGKKEEAEYLQRCIPMMPSAAAFIKKYLGLDALLAMDRNLAEVEQKYGKEWLTK